MNLLEQRDELQEQVFSLDSKLQLACMTADALQDRIDRLTEEREALRVTLRFLARAAATEPSMSIYQGHIEHALKLVA